MLITIRSLKERRFAAAAGTREMGTARDKDEGERERGRKEAGFAGEARGLLSGLVLFN